MTGTVTRIHIFPVKGLDSYSVTSAEISPAGSLVWDRRIAFTDSETGKYINWKNEPNIFRLRCSYEGAPASVAFSIGSGKISYSLTAQQDEIKKYLQEYFNKQLNLLDNPEAGHPDDTEASGPTIVSVQTLRTVQLWFPEMSVDELFLRFRCNILIEGVPAFWEEQFAGGGQFSIGTVGFIGAYPCARCKVPPVHPLTGEVNKNFQKEFAEQRRAMHPSFLDEKYYEHFYKVTLNTRIQQGSGGKIISVGDTVSTPIDRSMEF